AGRPPWQSPPPGSATRWATAAHVREDRRAGRSDANPYLGPGPPDNARQRLPPAERTDQPRGETPPRRAAVPRRSVLDPSGGDPALGEDPGRPPRQDGQSGVNREAA